MSLRDEEHRLAVAEDERELLGLRLRVDEREGTAGDERPEDRGGALRGVVEIESDPVAMLETIALENSSEPNRVVEQLAVGSSPVLVHDRVFVEVRRSGVEQAVVDEPRGRMLR